MYTKYIFKIAEKSSYFQISIWVGAAQPLLHHGAEATSLEYKHAVFRKP
jgi:hypothetical protein